MSTVDLLTFSIRFFSWSKLETKDIVMALYIHVDKSMNTVDKIEEKSLQYRNLFHMHCNTSYSPHRVRFQCVLKVSRTMPKRYASTNKYGNLWHCRYSEYDTLHTMKNSGSCPYFEHLFRYVQINTCLILQQ